MPTEPQTLVLRYTPRTGSRTAGLLDHAVAQLAGPVVTEDLGRQAPDLFDPVRIDAYTRRNYAGLPIDAEQTAALAGMDRLTRQLMDAQQVVLAFPVYNFSVPAAVKAWYDAVIQKQRTWTVRDGQYTGLMTGRRALVIATAGGPLRGAQAHHDHALTLARLQFEFMGFDTVDTVLADAINARPEQAPAALARARQGIDHVLRQWSTRDGLGAA